MRMGARLYNRRRQRRLGARLGRRLMKPKGRPIDGQRLERVVAQARREREIRERSYRGRALKLFAWVCARCAREFDAGNVRELTVHHKDHDHDNNPPDGSNWELLCVYCHENEHTKFLDSHSSAAGLDSTGRQEQQSHRPFADLRERLKRGE